MKHRHIVIMLGIVAITVLRASGLAWADESEHYAAAQKEMQKEIVFLLDTSVSMAAQDKEQKVTDAIRQAVYGLPSDAQAGFVAYNTEIQAAIPIGAKTEQIEEQLGAIIYGGYTNAGEGLSQAVKLFSGSRENKESYIVMLTDGEIDMPDRRRREVSRKLYSEAVEQAKAKGIKIYVVAIGSELAQNQIHVFDGAEATDGSIFWEGQSGTVSQIMNRIVKERMKIPVQTLAEVINEETGKKEIHEKIPDGLNRLKLIITSDGELEELSVDNPDAGGQLVSGKHFAVFEMENPDPGSIDITYGITGEALSEAYWIFDYAVIPSVSAKDPGEEMSQLMVIPFHSDENPPPQEVIHYWPLYNILSILMQFILILLIIWSWKKKQAADDTTKPRELKELPKKKGDKRELFSGKLSLYMIRTADGRDVPPQTYRLFGCEPGEMTLAQILKSCGIELGKIGGENIILYPGLNHAVMFKDLSENCTVMRGMEIMEKNRAYPVYYQEKITVLFEDEETEMEIHYKNLKPGERGSLVGAASSYPA
ncbi:MAG: VWA domain-containing protein [Lachnospiraceae bacterium]|nr:VWA domain-containing protein [Lachnospiraceae bacterium]